VRVPIPAGLLVHEARLDGKPVSLVAGSSGKGSSPVVCCSVASGPCGPSCWILVLPIEPAAGEESISLPSTASGITRASIVLPRRVWMSGSAEVFYQRNQYRRNRMQGQTVNGSPMPAATSPSRLLGEKD